LPLNHSRGFAIAIDRLNKQIILHPIDFIAFNGMATEDEISDILLLAREQCATLDPIPKQIKKVIVAFKYDWQVARIDDAGNINME